MGDKNIRVLLVSDMSKVGGTEIATYITAKVLKPCAKEVYVLGSKGPLSESIEKLGIENFDGISHTKNPIKIFKFIFKLIHLINKYEIDVIHAQMARPVPMAWLAKKISKRKRLKIFWTSRGLHHSTYKYVVPIFNKMNVRGLGNCKLEQQKLIRYGFEPLKTSYVYNAYRLNPITAPRPKLSKENITIGTLSALRQDRCVDLFLDIAKYISESSQFPHNIEFIIGGDGAYKKELESLAKKYNIEKKVKFLGNIVDVEEFMHNIDIFVSPIVVDGDSGAGISNAIVEAMLTKTPVCAYDASAIGEIVINNHTGYLVEPRNVEAMVNAIFQTIENKIQTQDYVENAFNLVIKECDPQNYAKKLILLYREL
ncbi:glycosyltransferase [Acinetobacter sp. DSM 11652]|uniref:glycosyltransferase n=1 Tax=Acinetobacter sp. DSM 11652 TaxID=346222 RepID=UPI0008AC786A|nr:glycosyltransferase [Acinetobacter sp. DSM 11652]SEM11024.1 Glycosyltransferase involved in cell wall bisynthesis [Acinetobacter sp. DSM 11652]